MRHQTYKYRIGATPAHRKSLMRNLSAELIEHGKIKTTLTRCKAVRSYIEKLVTLAKDDSVHHRRLAFAKLNNKEAVKKLFVEVGPKFKTRPGGYTRIVKLPEGRVGDNAPVAYIAFVE